MPTTSPSPVRSLCSVPWFWSCLSWGSVPHCLACARYGSPPLMGNLCRSGTVFRLIMNLVCVWGGHEYALSMSASKLSSNLPAALRERAGAWCEPIFPPRRLRCSDVRQQAQGYLGSVRCLPVYESDQGTSLTVLSTLCPWDISPMICGRPQLGCSPATCLPAS